MTKNTDSKTKELFLEQLRKTPIVQIACEKVGISRMTFYRIKKRDATFAKHAQEAIDEGCLLVNDLAESQLINEVKDRNFAAIAYWLRHHHSAYKQREFQAGFMLAQDGDQNMFLEMFGEIKPETKALREPYIQTLTKKNHDKSKSKS